LSGPCRASIRIAAFFFSSRRRHTRSKRDWSSDVCSSDLSRFTHSLGVYEISRRICDIFSRNFSKEKIGNGGWDDQERLVTLCARSEERRVGKECRCGVRGHTCSEDRKRETSGGVAHCVHL